MLSNGNSRTHSFVIFVKVLGKKILTGWPTLLLMTGVILTCQWGCHSQNKHLRATAHSEELLFWTNKIPIDTHFQQSFDITGIAFTPRHIEYTKADTWFPSWAIDDNLYSSYTDGEVQGIKAESWKGGKEGTTGQAVIIGDDPLHLNVTSLGLHIDSPVPYGGRYPGANLVYKGIWYYGTYCLDDIGGDCGNWCVMGPFVGFRISYDYGRTWTNTELTPQNNLFGENGKNIKFGAPHFVDFGKDMQHSPDDKAYLVAHGASLPNAPHTWIAGDEIYLSRVVPSPETINMRSQYEFFAGHDSNGTALWTKKFSDIKPLITWPNHCGCVTITYNAPLRKYLMCVTHGYPSIGTFDTCLLEADKITGPYRMVHYLEKFGPQAYFVNIPSKFISSDGCRAWLCFSANFVNDIPDANFPKYQPSPKGGQIRIVPARVDFNLSSYSLSQK